MKHTFRFGFKAMFICIAVVVLVTTIALSPSSTTQVKAQAPEFAVQNCQTQISSYKYAKAVHVEYLPEDVSAGVAGYIVTFNKPARVASFGLMPVQSDLGVEVFKSAQDVREFPKSGVVVVNDVYSAVNVFPSNAVVSVCQYVGVLGDNIYGLLNFPGYLVTVSPTSTRGTVIRRVASQWLTENPIVTATPVVSITPTTVIPTATATGTLVPTVTFTPTNTVEPFNTFGCSATGNVNITDTVGALGAIADGDPGIFKTRDANGNIISTFTATGLFVVTSTHNYKVEMATGGLMNNMWNCYYKGDLLGLTHYRQDLVTMQRGRGGTFCEVNIDSNGIITGTCTDPLATVNP